MVVRNDLDRFHLVMDVIDRVPKLQFVGAHVKQMLRGKLVEHKHYISKYGDDMPDIKDWKWPHSGTPSDQKPEDVDEASPDAANESESVSSRK